jgi:hypothetical protein
VASHTLELTGGADNTTPNTPASPSPVNDARQTSQTAALSWTGGDADTGDTVTYDVYVGTASPPTSLACDDVSATTCDPAGNFALSTRYYWQVVATDNWGGTTTGPIWTFVTYSPTGCPVNQFQADYFNNQTLTAPQLIQRCETAPSGILSRDWGTSSPGSGIGVDGFSVRWEGSFDFASRRNYTFAAKADDGVRVFVDGVKIIDRWTSATTKEVTAKRKLSVGLHRVTVEFVERQGTARVSVRWY